jgi:thymidine phosphorylase
MLAPMLAACGAFVPMISGRGLGHTGGTLDKLDSIPGYRSQPGIERFQRTVAMAGCAIIGQTPDLAPADKRLYAIRDVTATVESIPLITASILSKKLAAGLDGLVMDVKAGNGAFMAREREARDLAKTLVAVANGAGLETTALITDMNEALASAAGNGLEVQNAIEYLTGKRRDPRLHEVTMALGAELLVNAGLAATVLEARKHLADKLSQGEPAERFQLMVAELGGPHDLVERPDRHLAKAPIVLAVHPKREGRVAQIDTRALGLTVIGLGGGRRVVSDKIDHRVGLSELAGLGEAVGKSRPLAIVHAGSRERAEEAAAAVRSTYVLGEVPPARKPVIGQIKAPEP